MDEEFKIGNLVISKVPNNSDGIVIILVTENSPKSKVVFAGTVIQYIGGSGISRDMGVHLSCWNKEKFIVCQAEIIIKVKSK